MKFKFWSWVYRESNKKVRSEFRSADVRCSNCRQWYSELVALNVESNIGHTYYGFAYKCGCCGMISYFNTDAAPVALRCDASGNPYKVSND